MNNKLKIYVFVLLGVLALEFLIFQGINSERIKEIDSEHYTATKRMRFNHAKSKKVLNDNYDKKYYMATGKNVYERIYNIKNQSIIEMIKGLADESFPQGWKTEVKVEEFTNFILLVQKEIDNSECNVTEVEKYLIPIIEYSQPYLKNVAIFDEKHKCIMFFDGDSLMELSEKRKLSEEVVNDVLNKGQNFTRYNSIKIPFEVLHGHIFIPVIVGGKYEVMMMLDTGASTTVLSEEVASATSFQNEDLNKVEHRTFSTASGIMTCPILERKLSVGSLDIVQPIAVNFKDDTNLLGVDFFKDYNYRIDSDSKCIYVWSKE
ncbi:MAG: retropepsin-like aspartic protease [Candidatus Omnitrophica bacterium]|nr:retropepsin-like aspartic protease [Candidatus Omnitrophota bacterium]